MIINAEETKLTNKDAAILFGRVSSIDEDCSLYALYRAIVINHDDCTNFSEIQCKAAIGLHNIYCEEDLECVLNEDRDFGTLSLLNCGCDFRSINPEVEGWVTFDAPPYYLNRYLSQTTRTKVYINREKKRAVAVVENRAKSEWIQRFCSMLWVVLPWYFPEKNDDTIKFFKSISVDNKNVSGEEAKQILISYVNEAAGKLNIRELVLHQRLDGFADRIRQQEIESHRQRIDEAERYIRQYTDTLAKQYGILAAESTVLRGLEQMEPESDDSIIRFFQDHQNVSVKIVQGSSIYYAVTDTLEFYDEEEAKLLFDNDRSWAYDFTDSFAEMMKTIFVEKRGIFRVGAEFRISNMRMVHPRQGHCDEKECLPNPHVYFYACSGANDNYYAKYAEQGDWDLAIEQSISATKNWSVGDSTVGRRMFNWIIDNDSAKCIYVTDGSPMEGVTPECKLVSFEEYTALITAKKAEEAKESEAVDNG